MPQNPWEIDSPDTGFILSLHDQYYKDGGGVPAVLNSLSGAFLADLQHNHEDLRTLSATMAALCWNPDIQSHLGEGLQELFRVTGEKLMKGGSSVAAVARQLYTTTFGDPETDEAMMKIPGMQAVRSTLSTLAGHDT